MIDGVPKQKMYIETNTSTCLSTDTRTLKSRERERERDTHSRNLVVIHNFKVLVCVSDKVDVFGRKHLEVKRKVSLRANIKKDS